MIIYSVLFVIGSVLAGIGFHPAYQSNHFADEIPAQYKAVEKSIAQDRKSFYQCRDAVIAVSYAEEMHFVDHGYYTTVPDNLSEYLIPGCNGTVNCEGKVKERLDTKCRENTFYIGYGLTGDETSFSASAISKDSKSCKIRSESPEKTTPYEYDFCYLSIDYGVGGGIDFD